uniref:RING-type domain-containing protein n=1 Tax=Panagrellus redivivus TaxID=6233 RepID=A0A7E4VGQ4_PANRE
MPDCQLVTCGICYDEMEAKKGVATVECGHIFDKECMEQYVEHARQQIQMRYHDTDDEDRPQLEMRVPCPICRTPLEDDQFESPEKH